MPEPPFGRLWQFADAGTQLWGELEKLEGGWAVIALGRNAHYVHVPIEQLDQSDPVLIQALQPSRVKPTVVQRLEPKQAIVVVNSFHESEPLAIGGTQPGRMRSTTGLYLEKSGTRAVIVVDNAAVDPFAGQLPIQFSVNFFPGRTEAVTRPAKLLSRDHVWLFLEVDAPDLAAAPDWSQVHEEAFSPDRPVRIVKVEAYGDPDPTQINLILRETQHSPTSTDTDTPQTPHCYADFKSPQLPKAAIALNAAGQPFALLYQTPRLRDMRSAIAISKLLNRLVPKPGLPVLELVDSTESLEMYQLDILGKNSLRQVKSVEVYAVPVQKLAGPSAGPFDPSRPRFSGMERIPVEHVSNQVGNMQTFGVVVRKLSNSTAPLDLIVQQRLIFQDGKSVFVVPHRVSPNQSDDDTLLTSDAEAALFRELKTIEKSASSLKLNEFSPTSFPATTQRIPEANNGNIRQLWQSKIAVPVLPATVWTRDGASAIFVDRLGTLRKFRILDHSHARLTLGALARGLAESRLGIVVLADQQLWIIDPEDLRLKKRLPVAGARLLATSPVLDFAYVAIDDHIVRVDLETGKATLQDRSVSQDLAFQSVVALAISSDGKFLLCGDEQRLHQIQVDQGQSFIHVDSTVPIVSNGGTIILEQGGHRAAYPNVGGFGVPRPNAVTRAGFPGRGTLIFDGERLQQPLVSVPQAAFALDPATGGIIYPDATERCLVFVRSDGTRAGVFAGNQPGWFGQVRHLSLAPIGGEMLGISNQPGGDQVWQLRLPNKFLLPDYYRRQSTGSAPQGRSVVTKTETHGGWRFRWLKFPIAESFVSSWDGRVVYLVTSDKILHVLQVPELVEVRQMNLDFEPRSMALGSEGLVTVPLDRQELRVIDPETGAASRTIPLEAPVLVTTNSVNRWVWVEQEIPPKSRVEKTEHRFSALDLESGEIAKTYTANDLRNLIPQMPDNDYRFSLEPLRRPKQAPNGKWLFLTDGMRLFRFRTDGPNLAFEQLTRTLNRITTAASIYVSDDSQLVSLPGASEGLGGYGSQLLQAADFEKPAIKVLTDPHGSWLTVNSQAGEIYASGTGSLLQIFDSAGNIKDKIQWLKKTLHGGYVADPGGRGVWVLCGDLATPMIVWAEPVKPTEPDR